MEWMDGWMDGLRKRHLKIHSFHSKKNFFFSLNEINLLNFDFDLVFFFVEMKFFIIFIKKLKLFCFALK